MGNSESKPGQLDSLKKYFFELVKEYEQRADAFDDFVCTGRAVIGGETVLIPRTLEERRAVNANARSIRSELMSRAACECQLTGIECDKYWNDARQDRA